MPAEGVTMTSKPKPPDGLAPAGQALWKSVSDDHELDAVQFAQLTEACRQKDRLDKLDDLLRGEVDTWAEIATDREGEPISLRIDSAVKLANETANTMKQLLAALRLPDAAGKRPQRRGARGAQSPSVPGGAGKVSSIERARARKSG